MFDNKKLFFIFFIVRINNRIFLKYIFLIILYYFYLFFKLF